jgi:hypothetical protein
MLLQFSTPYLRTNHRITDQRDSIQVYNYRITGQRRHGSLHIPSNTLPSLLPPAQQRNITAKNDLNNIAKFTT